MASRRVLAVIALVLTLMLLELSFAPPVDDDSGPHGCTPIGSACE
jgi:hypothetical protein